VVRPESSDWLMVCASSQGALLVGLESNPHPIAWVKIYDRCGGDLLGHTFVGVCDESAPVAPG